MSDKSIGKLDRLWRQGDTEHHIGIAYHWYGPHMSSNTTYVGACGEIGRAPEWSGEKENPCVEWMPPRLCPTCREVLQNALEGGE